MVNTVTFLAIFLSTQSWPNKIAHCGTVMVHPACGWINCSRGGKQQILQCASLSSHVTSEVWCQRNCVSELTECGLCPSSSGIAQDLVGNADSWVLPQTY